MNKRIEKKVQKREQIAHERDLGGTSWGRIKLSLEHVGVALRGLLSTLQEESGVWQVQARANLQKGARAVDHSVSPGLARVPLVGSTAARNLHQFATDPHFAAKAHPNP